MGTRAIYLDHTATTPLDQRVLDAMLPFFSSTYGNASSVHSFGRAAKAGLEDARSRIAAAIGASPGELFFVSGGTESDNTALTGAWEAGRKHERDHIVLSAVEHHAVLDTSEALKEKGAIVSVVPVNVEGRVDPSDIAGAVTGRTAIVSVMHANNEVGTINPIHEIAESAHRSGALMHSDAVQTLGKIPVNVDALGVDLLSISAHKLYGPKGVGALYIRRGTEIEPLLHGGGQERGRRPGTENVALVVGFARAVQIALEDQESDSKRIRGLRDGLQAALTERYPFLIVNGDSRNRLDPILNLSVDSAKQNVEGEMLVPSLDIEGVAVTSGSACTSGSMQPSHVLLAMGRDVATAKATVRFSFGRSNTREDVVETVARFSRVMTRLCKE